MPSEAATKLIEESTAKLTAQGGESSIGTQVFNSIQNSELTPQEKQEVFREVAKNFMETTTQNLDPNNYLRGNSKGTNFMAAYMKEYAKDYFESVAKEVVEKVNSVELPEGIGNKPVPRINAGKSDERDQEISSSTYKQMDQIYKDVGQTIIESTELNMDKLSPEARAFLKDTSDVLVKAGHPEMVPTFMANTVVLRGVTPHLVQQMPKLDDTRLAPVLTGGTQVSQGYTNALPLEQPDMSKNEAPTVKEMRTPARLEASRKQFENLGKGGSLDVSKDTLYKETVGKLEAKLDKLNKPSLWDRIKAIPDGGISKQKEKLIAKIDEAKMEYHRKVNPEEFKQFQKREEVLAKELNNIKGTMVENAIAHDQAKIDLRDLQIKSGLAGSGIYPGDETVEDLQKQIQEKQGIVAATKNDAKEWESLDKESKALEKNVSVRESLGKNVGNAPEAPKTKVSVK